MNYLRIPIVEQIAEFIYPHHEGESTMRSLPEQPEPEPTPVPAPAPEPEPPDAP